VYEPGAAGTVELVAQVEQRLDTILFENRARPAAVSEKQTRGGTKQYDPDEVRCGQSGTNR
jgi:hypothetical protein